ncbi:DDB1- and CUL4-associated factor 6-like [Actinia tenebrosa]|uniref:DDB1- and CUL4-associated factor 6-like n=1 Tax=Actinia tenebrosa TaxID=6105 RepID=A0A6P8HP17_ACTTE|nr:DDB1- and CUL4-associated factor 6-like [Actinia tenebrosa]
MRDTLYQTLQQRVYGSVTPDLLFKRARDSKYLLQCLQRTGTLTGHDGCVNTIAWSDSGDLLLSGSDDCRLNIYRPYQHKLLKSISTGHRANIFSAAFLPCTANKQIVSCAGDGMIHFTELQRPELYGKCSYNCHSGTAYELVTTPGDPNTFKSCGEDGTVRLFDIRTKSKCSARNCKEDVLIDYGKAITSMGVNPLTPYQLAIGCEDSTVALFDCRSLSTANSSRGMKGMLCKFKPDSLKDRTCRVTSLQYSSDGCELLVSYCADYVYLFNMRGEKEVRLTCEGGGHENGAFSNDDSKRSLPLKRLRLRGDWSDTGPNARPESEAASSESTLMQRMSDLFVRWIEESFRGNQRNRARTGSHTRSESSSSSSSMPSLPSLPSRVRSSSDSSRATNISETLPFDEGTSNQDSVDMNVDESSNDVFETASSGTSNMMDAEDQKKDDDDDDGTDEKMDLVLNIDHTVAGPSGVKIEVTSPNTTENKDTKEDDPDSDREDMEAQSNDDSNNASGTPGANLEKTTEGKERDCKQGVEETHGNVSEGVTEVRDEISEGVAEARGNVSEGVAVTRGNVSEGVAETRGNVSEGVAEIRGNVSEGVAVTRGNVSEGVAVTHGEVSPGVVTTEPNQESLEHHLAAIRIQRLFRNYKLIKNFEQTNEPRDGEMGEQKEVWIPKMTRVFRGHRNARTMIKEARFWGDRFIMSGSDCGRIFIWDKDTTEIVMTLQGDRHVVNCVQPHPFDPILASSGIDYDIKLWAPTADTPLQIDGLDEIIKRNEQMLEESRDTITVPASFMLRMLASLNHARFARNQEDSDTDSTDEA